MINNDVLSSQAANRQRRHAADERARIDRIVTDTSVREGVARQAGEAPSREEVTQFRNLLRSQGREDRPLDGGKPAAHDTRSPAGAHAPRLAGELAGMSTAERFRALMQQAFAQVGDRDAEPARSEQPAQPQETRTPARADKPEASPPDTRASEAARAASDAQARKPAEEADAKPVVDAGQAKPDDEAGAPTTRRGDETKPKAGTGEAESVQQAARKAADGEAQVGQAARVAHGDDEMDEGEGAGSASSQAGAGGMPTPMSADMAPMPAQPQAMPAEMAQQAAASGSLAPALSELVQKHVRQMLVSDPRSLRGRSREVLLRMQNDVLPGTDLWLTQTSDGWQLRADVRSRDAYDTLLANQDELVQRFADGALGKLTIEPVFHS